MTSIFIQQPTEYDDTWNISKVLFVQSLCMHNLRIKITMSGYIPSPSPNNGYLQYWIDLIDDTTWAHSGETATYTSWNHGRPRPADRQCAGISQNSSWKWNDLHCQTKYAYICEK